LAGSGNVLSSAARRTVGRRSDRNPGCWRPHRRPGRATSTDHVLDRLPGDSRNLGCPGSPPP
jgi:hypothetical protein